MIKPLRKKHLQIWIAWAVLLPLCIAAAYISVKKPATDTLLQPAAGIELPLVLKKNEKQNYSITVRSNADTSQLQLQWINKRPLTFPTATIYKTALHTINMSEGVLIGRIEGRGEYFFPVDTGFYKSDFTLVVYDFIHKQIIDTVTF